MASVSDPDPDSDADTEASTPLRLRRRRRGPILVSSDTDTDSEPERPPRHLRAPSRTPSWAKSVSRSPSPIVHRRKRAKRSVSPGIGIAIGRWGGDDEKGYESAESGRIRLRKERSPSVLREEESDDEGVSGSGSEVEVSSGESGVDDSEDEDKVESDGESEATSAIEEQLHPDSPTGTAQMRIKRQESPDQELQSDAMSKDEESEDEKEASSSGAEDNAETEPEAETESEVEPEPQLEIESEQEAESEVEAGSEAQVESESEAEFEVESEAETKFESEAGVDSEAESGTETKFESEAELESEAEVETETKFESEAEVELEVETEEETRFESEAERDSETEADSEVDDMPEPWNGPEDSPSPSPRANPNLNPNQNQNSRMKLNSQTNPSWRPNHFTSAEEEGEGEEGEEEEEEEEEEISAPLASPNKRPTAPLDSPSPSDQSEAGAEEDAESHYTDSGEDESENEFAEIKPTATISSASKGRPKRAAAQRAAEQRAVQRAAERAAKKQAAARRAAARRGERVPKVTGRTRGRQVDVYNPKYIELLNDQIELAASRGLSEIEHDRERVTPVLGSVWTRRERDIFFKYIAIVGKDNVAELSRLIGTKSIVECRAYVKALQDGREHDWHAPAKRWIREREIVSSRDIPAAMELSDECVEALEEEADALELRIRKDEERREKVKWGDLWRLDAASSWIIEKMYKKNEIDEIREIAPEAELLNIHNMLEISESIFMNGSGDDYNWQFLGSDSPAIRHTAFKDIHTLIVSLIRRIVQTTIYMATSRLRGMESQVFGGSSKSKLIRPADVKAAVNCLGLPENSREYWIRIPRRTGLHVYNRKEDIRKKSNIGFIPYDELEQVLKSTRAYGSGSAVNQGDNGDDKEDDEAVEAKMDALLAAAYVERNNNEGIKGEDASDLMDSEISDLDSETSIDGDEDEDDEIHESADSDMDLDGTLRSKPQKKLDSNLEAIDDAEDVYMEVLDKKRSYKEEKALWELMGREPSQPLPKVAKPLPELFPLERKRPLDLMNWRDSAGYLASWETDKRRKTKHDGGLWRGDDDISTAFHSAATLSEPQMTTKVHEHKVIPKKKKRPTAKK
ncbi:uncharacterized protein LAJ45_00291 [Morchella importuna]|uniref:uncharacterized protein n=1 Tax=Morchella importuna TaxID=1174673 RepID=UPI001E8EB006|nr:uncharacterized protein LAJ45_00291 [Morchella importuna]KAH8155281.1 hypothetical protein LAJ45_00291 [Morchella importuna]